MTKVSSKEGAHERLECPSLAVEICVRQINALEVAYDRSSFSSAKSNVVFKHLRVFFPSLLIESLEPDEKAFFGLLSCVFCKDLEVVRLPLLARLSLVPELAED